MFFAPQKKITISTTISKAEWETCKKEHLKYNQVFSLGLKSLSGTAPLALRLQEAESVNANLVKKLESLMGRIRALEEREANGN